MNVFACISFVDVILKLIICYLVISVSIDKLITYAALIVIIQLIDQSLYWIYCRRHFPESHFRFYPYEPLYKEMLGMVSWGLFAHVPYVVNMSLQNILLNVFLHLLLMLHVELHYRYLLQYNSLVEIFKHLSPLK